MKEIKAWIVISKKTKKPARFARELSPVEYEVFPHKYIANKDYFISVPCTISYSLPKNGLTPTK